MSALFGVTLPVYTPTGIFPVDPDYNFKRGRKWETKVHRFSPVLEQRFILTNTPEITFEIGFDAMKGTFSDSTKKFNKIWTFFSSHKGRAVPFYFYDPVPWGTANMPYKEDPTQRPSSPGTGANPAPTVGRYVMIFDEDEVSFEQFEAKVRRGQLKLTGFAG